MNRDTGNRMGPAARIALAAKMRAHLEARPGSTIVELCAVTGAGVNMATRFRERWRLEREKAASRG